jgi:hypothetical protein
MLKLLIHPWLNLLWPSFFGIGMGPSQGEYQQKGLMGNIGSFSTSTGEKDIGASSDFFNAILSGDPTKLSRVLGPLYSNINQRGGEEMKTLSEFGTRSGGTGAEQQAAGDKMRAQASEAEAGLLGASASNLSSMGSGLLSTGESATEAAFNMEKTIQQQKQAKINDIFKSVMEVASAVVPVAGIAGVGAGAGAIAGGSGASASSLANMDLA